MTDDTPQNPREGLPPVRMALRVIGRHGHRGGPHLARAVAGARAPKHLGASTRLARQAEPERASPPVPAPSDTATPAPAPSAAAGGLVPGIDRPSDPGLSDFASEFLFGDAGAAMSGLTPMAQAEKLTDSESAKEARLAPRRARGALDVSRAAKILEGRASGPASADEIALPELASPAGPIAAPAPAPVKVSGRPPDT